jgi:hypothetical protein
MHYEPLDLPLGGEYQLPIFSSDTWQKILDPQQTIGWQLAATRVPDTSMLYHRLKESQ